MFVVGGFEDIIDWFSMRSVAKDDEALALRLVKRN